MLRQAPTLHEQLKFAMGLYNTQSFDEAVREFQKLIKHYPRAREAPEAQFYIAKSFQDQDKLLEAFKEYQAVVEKYPFSERAAEIVEIQYNIGQKFLDGDAKKGGVLSAFSAGDSDIPEIFRTVIKNAPYGKFAAPSQYKIGLFFMEKGEYLEARDEFEKVINDYPDSEWAKAAKFQIASSDSKRSTDAGYDQKITEAAVEEFQGFVEAYPDAELSEHAKDQISELKEKEAQNHFMVAKFYEKQKNYKSAKIYYKMIIDDYKNSKFSQKALEKYREMSLKDK